jgi:hypothetical protein
MDSHFRGNDEDCESDGLFPRLLRVGVMPGSQTFGTIIEHGASQNNILLDSA